MIGRVLPFVEQCKALEGKPEELEALVGDNLKQLFALPAWQIVLDLMRDIVTGSLKDLSNPSEVPQFHAGRISAVEQVREELRKIADTEQIDSFDEELTDERE